MLSILVSLSLHAAVLSRCMREKERCVAHASEKKYEKQVQSVSKKEGKFGVGWGAGGKRITREGQGRCQTS